MLWLRGTCQEIKTQARQKAAFCFVARPNREARRLSALLQRKMQEFELGFGANISKNHAPALIGDFGDKEENIVSTSPIAASTKVSGLQPASGEFQVVYDLV
jgi:hypothetical protein